MTIAAGVHDALSRNDVREAFRLLTDAAGAGDADASFELGVWFLEGRLLRRDLSSSRAHFSRAAALGHQRAQLIRSALLATGTGGPRQWADALDELQGAAGNNVQAGKELEAIAKMNIDAEGSPLEPPSVEWVSRQPQIGWSRAFFTPLECELLREIAAPFLNPSVVVDPSTGEMRPDSIRTSEAAAFPRIDETPFIHALNRRIAAASKTSVTQGEPLQVLRYAPGQEYRHHSDALDDTDNQRVMTVLVYLNEDYSGGETSFPAAGLELKGRQGDALIFTNVDRLGKADPHALHAGRPVTAGQKWLASRWIREKAFGP